jgi:flagellar assembly protein FliH
MASPVSQRLIKARSQRSPASATVFNFDDLRRQCDDYVSQARQQGEQLLARAAAEADEVRRQAHAQGLAAGQREGLESARHLVEERAAQIATEQTQEKLKTALPAFEQAVQALRLERDRWLTIWESAAVKLSAAIAEKIVRHELARQPDLKVAMIREALQLAAGQPHLRLRLHSQDFTLLQSCGHDALGQLANVGEIEFIEDESIYPGGCVIETRHGVLDARLETQIARITEELLDES